MQLKQYPAERIRNVGLFSHGGAGKTSLAEALLFDTGAITRLGRVEEGNTVSDFDPDEVKRHISVSAAILPLEWRDHKLNLVDAPGSGGGALHQGVDRRIVIDQKVVDWHIHNG